MIDTMHTNTYDACNKMHAKDLIADALSAPCTPTVTTALSHSATAMDDTHSADASTKPVRAKGKGKGSTLGVKLDGRGASKGKGKARTSPSASPVASPGHSPSASSRAIPGHNPRAVSIASPRHSPNASPRASPGCSRSASPRARLPRSKTEDAFRVSLNGPPTAFLEAMHDIEEKGMGDAHISSKPTKTKKVQRVFENDWAEYLHEAWVWAFDEPAEAPSSHADRNWNKLLTESSVLTDFTKAEIAKSKTRKLKVKHRAAPHDSSPIARQPSTDACARKDGKGKGKGKGKKCGVPAAATGNHGQPTGSGGVFLPISAKHPSTGRDADSGAGAAKNVKTSRWPARSTQWPARSRASSEFSSGSPCGGSGDRSMGVQIQVYSPKAAEAFRKGAGKGKGKAAHGRMGPTLTMSSIASEDAAKFIMF